MIPWSIHHWCEGSLSLKVTLLIVEVANHSGPRSFFVIISSFLHPYFCPFFLQLTSNSIDMESKWWLHLRGVWLLTTIAAFGTSRYCNCNCNHLCTAVITTAEKKVHKTLCFLPLQTIIHVCIIDKGIFQTFWQ